MASPYGHPRERASYLGSSTPHAVATKRRSFNFGCVREAHKLSRTLALGVVAVALFNTLSALSLPIPEGRPSVPLVVTWLVLLLSHSALYWFGSSLRSRFGLVAYVGLQAAIVLAIGLTGALFPVGVALYIALTAELVLIAAEQWGTIAITLGAIVIFAANAVAVADLYRGATAGLLLAITGVIAHAVAGLLQRQRSAPNQPAVTNATPPSNAVQPPSNLTPRELEVLRAMARGARNSQIATDLAIAERTVKAHLASIYQKLGVESRSAAVAVALKRGLTDS